MSYGIQKLWKTWLKSTSTVSMAGGRPFSGTGRQGFEHLSTATRKQVPPSDVGRSGTKSIPTVGVTMYTREWEEKAVFQWVGGDMFWLLHIPGIPLCTFWCRLPFWVTRSNLLPVRWFDWSLDDQCPGKCALHGSTGKLDMDGVWEDSPLQVLRHHFRLWTALVS